MFFLLTTLNKSVNHKYLQVDVSTRRGSWIFSRFFPGGLPADFLANTRFMMGMPKRILQWMVELMTNFKYNGENYGLQAFHR